MNEKILSLEAKLRDQNHHLRIADQDKVWFERCVGVAEEEWVAGSPHSVSSKP